MKRFVLVALLTVLSLLATACGGAQGVKPNPSGELTIFQEDGKGSMKFSPNTIILTAGQRVRLILENKGQKDHEFMIGRTIVYNDAGETQGFKEDFFAPIADQVNVQLGMGSTVMMGGQVLQGMDMSGNMGGMNMGNNMGGMNMGGQGMPGMNMGGNGGGDQGWMVLNTVDSGQTVIEFTVPESAVGEWEFGCFQDKGSHYDDGMRGRVIVVKP